jgi:single-stranded-DNA-specific exonuclease
LATELEKLNQERALLQNQIWDEVRVRVEKGVAEGKYRHGIVIADPKWHEGVVGIVASRVTETFRKPAVVIALREDFGKGSVRSFGGKDVLGALRQCASQLRSFGGHKHAAGISVDPDRIEAFAQAFDQVMETVVEDAQGGTLWLEGPCSFEELTTQCLLELEKLGPFGPGNPEPVFTLRAFARNHRILKGRHLKMSLTPAISSQLKALHPLDAIWFHGAEHTDVIDGSLFHEDWEWAGVPELNRFRGQMTTSFRIKDLRKMRSLSS